MLQTFLNVDGLMEKDINHPSGPIPEDSQWNEKTNLMRPRVLKHLQSFIKVCDMYKTLPALKALAEKMLGKLKTLWPETKSMICYTAFK